jgi:hypothetical protein
MKFRTGFGSVGPSIIFAGLWVLILLVRSGHSVGGMAWFAGGLCILVALIEVLRYQFVYWELSPACFREHRFGKVSEVSWNEVTRIASIPPNRPLSKSFVVEFCHNREITPYTGRDHIMARPGDRDGFVAELRRFAPRADFEV